MVYIDQVTKIEDSQGYMIIDKLYWTENFYSKASQYCSKGQMIDYINNHPNNAKTKYIRNGQWVVGEDVRVVDNSYLRTDGNKTLRDNLGELEI